ncbi:uncharacterized protein [Eurosta solidaginis]|uniref:uncharacterized protein isoform X2 n=1 Tax=Eurosta solidaginis TaxID=178769 RepID=UPI003530E5E9
MTALAVVGDENLTNVDFYDSCTKNYSLPDALITCSLIFLIKISNKEADENSTYHSLPAHSIVIQLISISPHITDRKKK